MELHDQDFYEWTQTQAALLRSGNISRLDIANLIEEIEEMGISVRNQLESRLTILMAHLLKWDFQAAYRSRGWELTIKEQRMRIDRLLRKNPSLKSYLLECIEESYAFAVIAAAKETMLPESAFPEHTPYTLEQIVDGDYGK